MTKKGLNNERNWSKVTAKSDNGLTNQRPGYHVLINNIMHGSRRLRKTKRGLSIFEDTQTQEQINENVKIPIFKDDTLTNKFDKLLKITEKTSGYETVTQRTKEEREKKKKKVETANPL